MLSIVANERTATYTRHSVDEGPARQGPGPVHRLAVVLGAPGGAVDVDVVRVETESARLHRVVHRAVQHPDPWTIKQTTATREL